MRTTRPRRRPSGNARNTCKKSTGGNRSSACPIVKGTSLLAIDSVDPKVAKPAAIINLPNPLAGRRHHAKSPQRTYDSVSHTVSIAITRGSPSSAAISLISASAQEVPAAARPAIAITHASDNLGGARAARRSTPAASAEATIHLPSPLPSPVTEPLRATATKTARDGRDERSRLREGYSFQIRPKPSSRRSQHRRLVDGEVDRAVRDHDVDRVRQRASPRLDER